MNGRPQITAIVRQGRKCVGHRIKSGELLSIFSLADEHSYIYPSMAVLLVIIYRTAARIVTTVLSRSYLDVLFERTNETLETVELHELCMTELFDMTEQEGYEKVIGALLAETTIQVQ
ncbi:MAG: hypothetical protein MMC33_004842 [Icmadophila ericetorum]|nr:hypothetical protein [Icmadophila ericetorum]